MSDPVTLDSISAVTLGTHDMNRAVDFYRALGFELAYGGRDATFTGFRAGYNYLNLSEHPDGMIETIGDKLGFMSRRVNGDLERFRHFIQERATPTGSYRETLENPKAPGGFTSGRPGSDLH